MHSIPELRGSDTLQYFSGFLRGPEPQTPNPSCQLLPGVALFTLSHFARLQICPVPSPSFPKVPASWAGVCDPLLPTSWGQWRALAARLRAGKTPHVICQTAAVLNSVAVLPHGAPSLAQLPTDTLLLPLLFQSLSPLLQATSKQHTNPHFFSNQSPLAFFLISFLS